MNNEAGGLQLLEGMYNFKFPFDIEFCMCINPYGPSWNPNAPSQWLGLQDKFTVWLPDKPESIQDHAEILAHYLQEFPSMLGSASVSAPPDFAAFGVITGRLIALAWTNSVFFDSLVNPESADTVAVIQISMDYIFPWNSRMEFKRRPQMDSSNWRSFPRTRVTLYIPRAPQEAEVHPVALAAYNGTGDQYPFSCG